MILWDDVLNYAKNGNLEPDEKLLLSEDEWKEKLTAEQYTIARSKGTERPFSNESCHLFEPGIYKCLCCEELLFDGSTKFDSGTGWPSFTQPIKKNGIAYHMDNSLARERVEVTCNKCDAHLGHVFPDGPEPSGLRYCINSAVIEKV